jgi:hypothetical protein
MMAKTARKPQPFVGRVERLGERHYRAAIYRTPITDDARPVSHCLHKHRSVEAARRCVLAAFKKAAARMRARARGDRR